MPTLPQHVIDILDGKYDENLDGIAEALRTRRATLVQRNVVGIKPGDTVKFSDSIRPKYLAGMAATVVKRNAKSIVVDVPADPAYGRFSGARGVRCPNSLIAGAQ